MGVEVVTSGSNSRGILLFDMDLPLRRDINLRLWFRTMPLGVQDEKRIVAVAEVVVVYVGTDGIRVAVTQEGRVCARSIDEGTFVVQVLARKVIDKIVVTPSCEDRC